MDLEHLDAINDWDKWKETLKKAVNLGHTVGFSDETITKMGSKIGNVLSSSVDPENKEQRLLQELWNVGEDEDRQVLSKLIVKMVQNNHYQ